VPRFETIQAETFPATEEHGSAPIRTPFHHRAHEEHTSLTGALRLNKQE
jgi:hypothetical protein